jgi:lipocalin
MTTTTVADLMADMHGNELRGVADVLARYVSLVRKVAEGGSLTDDEAVTAASCAYELKLPPDRFDRDVGTWRNVAAMDARIAEDEANKPTADDARAEREKLAALEKAVEEQRLKMRRDVALGMARVTMQTQRREMAQANPHLYGNGVLSDREWAAVRH